VCQAQGYQKHLLSLKVMTSQTEEGPESFKRGFGGHESQWVKLQKLDGFGKTVEG